MNNASKPDWSQQACTLHHTSKMSKVTKTIGILIAICLHSSSAFQAVVSSRTKILTPATTISRNLANNDEQISSTMDTATINGDDSASSSSSEPVPAEPQEFQRRNVPPPSISVDQMMLAMGTSPRRLFLGTVSATGIALAGNFLGVTSKLLTAVPEEIVEKTSLDTYFPRVSKTWMLI